MKTLGIIAVIIIIAAAGWYWYSTRQRPNVLGIPSSTVGAKEIVVDITASGFSPAEATINAGDTVKFVNKDSKNHWPASGVHPTHQLCPGFNALQAVKPGESYSFTFTEKKECPMHDHLNPTLRGKIIVQ